VLEIFCRAENSKKNMSFQMGPKPSFWTKMKNIWQTNIGVMKFPFPPEFCSIVPKLSLESGLLEKLAKATDFGRNRPSLKKS
jgi:hypothetical protein